MRFDWSLPFESHEYKLFYRMQSSLCEEFIKLYGQLKARLSMNHVDAAVGCEMKSVLAYDTAWKFWFCKLFFICILNI